MTWDGTVFDPYGLMALNNVFFFTCPLPTSYWEVRVGVNGNAAVSTRIITSIYKNGAESVRGTDLTTTAIPNGQASNIIPLVNGDQLSISIFVSTALQIANGLALSWVSIAYVGVQ
jgi:hypothetical protein